MHVEQWILTSLLRRKLKRFFTLLLRMFCNTIRHARFIEGPLFSLTISSHSRSTITVSRTTKKFAIIITKIRFELYYSTHLNCPVYPGFSAVNGIPCGGFWNGIVYCCTSGSWKSNDILRYLKPNVPAYVSKLGHTEQPVAYSKRLFLRIHDKHWHKHEAEDLSFQSHRVHLIITIKF